MKLLYPDTLESLQNMVAEALAEETALKIEGCGTLDGVGRPVNAQKCISMKNYTGIIDYDPAELVLVARAGTRLREVEELLASENQLLAFEPPHFNSLYEDVNAQPTNQTIGGVIGAGLAGSRRISAGSARDYLLGFTAISGRAELFKSGSRVMKNVTGYDLSKLMTGSFGTLAIMDEITLKVLPAPEVAYSCIVPTSDMFAAQKIVSQIFASPVEASGGVVVPVEIAKALSLDIGGQGAAAIIRIEGIEISVLDRINQIRELLCKTQECFLLENQETTKLWRALCNGKPLSKSDQIWQISTPPASGPSLFKAISDRTDISGFLDWAGGLVWIAGKSENLHDIIRTELASHGGGHATLLKADINLRQHISVFQPLPSALHALEVRVRDAFDPRHILNPNRTLPAIAS